MLGEIREVKRNKIKAMVIRVKCSVEELPALLGRSYGKLTTYMGRKGSIPAGAPYVAYFNQDMNNLEVEIGIPTAIYMPDADGMIMSGIPEGNFVSGLYTGTYSGLKEAYGQMAAYVAKHKLVIQGAAYESYLNDPVNTSEEDLLTEILFQVG